MAIKIIFATHHQRKLIRNQSHRHAAFSLKESSANPARFNLANPSPRRTATTLCQPSNHHSMTPVTWNPVATLLLTSSPYLWIDQNPVSGNKFYRAVMLPLGVRTLEIKGPPAALAFSSRARDS